MEKARAHLFIDGRVQGVFFRGFTRDLAARLGLDGWVRNLRDGRVEAIFEGGRNLVEQAIGECRKGPPSANVTDVDVKWEAYSGKSRGFEIRY
jgi:acylphosphatase